MDGSFYTARGRDRAIARPAHCLGAAKSPIPLLLAIRLQLLRLFCPDFPLELVTDACKLCGDGGGTFPTEDLLLAWRARFFYAEFLERTAEVFETCDTRAQGRVDRNVLCLTCRQMLSGSVPQLKRMPCPPPAVFDELLVDDRAGGDSDIRLLDMQRLLVHTPVARAALACGPESGTGPQPSLVSSPPPPSSRGGGGHQQSVALDRLLSELSKEGEGVAASLPRRRAGGKAVGGARRATSTAAGTGRTATGCGSARSLTKAP